MRNDLISKSELLTNLIHCKGLGRRSFEALIEFLEDYPTDVNMDNIKEQIKNASANYIFDRHNVVRAEDVMIILDKGGV